MIIVSVTANAAARPCCGICSWHVHSQYCRTLRDLPCQGVLVRICLRTHRFYCSVPDRGCRILTQRLPVVALPYDRPADVAMPCSRSAARWVGRLVPASLPSWELSPAPTRFSADALQVADRFHVFCNLTQALQRLLERLAGAWRRVHLTDAGGASPAASSGACANSGDTATGAASTDIPTTSPVKLNLHQQQSQQRRESRKARSGISEFLRTRRKRNWPLPGTPEPLGMEKEEKTAPEEAVGRTTGGGQEAKTEILS